MKLCIIALLLLGSVSATQEAGAQTFEQFAVREVYSGQHAKAPPGASKKHKAALSKPVNFSGHYIVYFYPCGGGCITGSVIDVKEGDIVAALPDVYVIDSFKSTFRPTSTLMVITGQSAQEGGAVKTVFYNFVEDEFRPLKTEQQ